MKDYTITEGIFYSIVIGGAIIFTRILYSYALMYFPRFCSKEIRLKTPKPDWREPFIISFAAMRGVVSLAAALSIPLFASEGQPFPYRSLILFITFIVILVTLVLQGLTLPWLIKKLNLQDKYALIPESKQEMIIQKKLAQLR